ncbi:PQQ-binding-like beta-propeller repeat protein [Streptomyces sp. NPDC007901]|uniref:outer membrane protein assembly factor BamB family protein n=1 Tax=Streptomyces sp. NPDC007901 TaxID=3364785 RepID=UPI0036EFA813
MADGTVYIGGDHRLIALDAADGGKRWELRLGDPTWSTPAVADGTVYIGSNGWYLWAVDAATGKKRWKRETGEAQESSPAVADGTVYIGSEDMSLWGPSTWAARTTSCARCTPDARASLHPGRRAGAARGDADYRSARRGFA